MLRDGIVTSVLIGASKAEQIVENIAMLENLNFTEAELCEIDGNFLVYEDILELPIEDVITLQAAISGKFQLAQPSA